LRQEASGGGALRSTRDRRDLGGGSNHRQCGLSGDAVNRRRRDGAARDLARDRA
jgi:hypothetical protein